MIIPMDRGGGRGAVGRRRRPGAPAARNTSGVSPLVPPTGPSIPIPAGASTPTHQHYIRICAQILKNRHICHITGKFRVPTSDLGSRQVSMAPPPLLSALALRVSLSLSLYHGGVGGCHRILSYLSKSLAT